MSSKPPRKRVYSPKTAFKDLTVLQQKVVVYMYENSCSPWDCVRAGVCSKASIELWRVTNVRAWVGLYKDNLPMSPLDLANHVQSELNGLLQHSIRVLRDTLIAGEGNSTAVKTAQYVLDTIKQAGADHDGQLSSDIKEAENELALVLQMVQNK